ncbi:MAG TPA: flagellar hook capping FlgD N-terminal domain-containing protein [Oscillatoriaceae cyanobacterium]
MSTGTTGTGLVGNAADLIGAAGKATASTTNGGGALDKNAFLKLLTTQLSNQDPEKPMDDTSFVSEMAQFSSLEQMQNLNDTMSKSAQFASLSQASGLIGQYVQLVNTSTDASGNDQSNTVTGLVTEVRQAGDKTNVVIDGQAYDSSTITNVSDKPITDQSQTDGSSGSSDANSGAAGVTSGNSSPTNAAGQPDNTNTSILPGASLGL